MADKPRLRTRATVLAIHAESIEVEACGAGRCANCPGGCNWGGFRGPRRLALQPPSSLRVQVGDQVWIALSRHAMLRAAWWAYGSPLTGLLVGAGLGHLLGGDGSALVGAVCGSILGFMLAARVSRRSWVAPTIESIAAAQPT